MTSQHIFCTSFVLTVISFICFYAFFNPKPTMQMFKRSGSKEAAQEILDAWGSEGLAKARHNLAFDWFFILIYSTMWVSGALYVGPLVDATLRAPAMLFAGIGLAGALCDVIENACLRTMLHGNGSDTAPRTCKRLAPINVALFLVTALYFLTAAIVACRSNAA
jgi:hypothetical protein